MSDWRKELSDCTPESAAEKFLKEHTAKIEKYGPIITKQIYDCVQTGQNKIYVDPIPEDILTYILKHLPNNRWNITHKLETNRNESQWVVTIIKKVVNV